MLIRLLLAGLVLVICSCTSLGKKPFYQDEGVAIEGYDSVAYFKQKIAIKGSPSFSYNYQGNQWNFSTAENRQAFIIKPEKYIPQYGGYCAYAMSKGFVVSSDPTAFTVYQGKLYLNYSHSVMETWREDIPGYLSRSEVNWKEKLSEIDN